MSFFKEKEVFVRCCFLFFYLPKHQTMHKYFLNCVVVVVVVVIEIPLGTRTSREMESATFGVLLACSSCYLNVLEKLITDITVRQVKYRTFHYALLFVCLFV